MRFDFEVHVDNMYFLSCLSYVGVKRVELTNNVKHRKKTKKTSNTFWHTCEVILIVLENKVFEV